MNTKYVRVFGGLILVALLGGCGTGWKMDYGEPEAQFLQADLVSKGQAFVGKKITVKGVVAEVDVSDPASAWVHLEGGVQCDFGKFKVMAESCEVGDMIYVDGILSRCEEGDVLIAPAVQRDSKAPFSPES